MSDYIICDDTGVIYRNVGSAATDLGISEYKIRDVLSGKLKSINGYTFSRLEDGDKKLNRCSRLDCAEAPGSPVCRHCGWSPAEHERRLGMIHAGMLRRNDVGLRALYVKES